MEDEGFVVVNVAADVSVAASAGGVSRVDNHQSLSQAQAISGGAWAPRFLGARLSPVFVLKKR